MNKENKDGIQLAYDLHGEMELVHVQRKKVINNVLWLSVKIHNYITAQCINYQYI